MLENSRVLFSTIWGIHFSATAFLVWVVLVIESQNNIILLSEDLYIDSNSIHTEQMMINVKRGHKVTKQNITALLAFQQALVMCQTAS